MNNSKTPNHPWRTRTHEFASKLTLMPRAERERIEAAEREYLAQRGERSSRQQTAARDFETIMHGVRDNY